MINNKLAFILLLSVILILTTCRKVEKVMMVTTGTVNDITYNTASVSGQIVDLGEGATQYGHYYSTTPNETLSGLKTQLSNPSGKKVFTSQLTGLSNGTKYYIKAYLSDGTKTVYGKEISFSTVLASLPVITSIVVENATPNILEIAYNLSLTNIIPASSAFVVKVNTITRTITAVTVSGTKVQLTLSSPVLSGDVITLTYTKPATNPLQTPSGGLAATVIDQNVTNSVLCTAPSVTTNAVTSLTISSATLNGTVNANGFSATVTFEYGTTTGYGTTLQASPNVVTGSVNTTVSAGVIGLTSNTLYHYRVIAVSCGRTIYGSDMVFTSLVLVTTNAITNITGTTASGGGSIAVGGGASISERGVCWNTSPSPTIVNSKTIDGQGTGSFVSSLTGLNPNTTYYVRAYATNSGGTTYGAQVNFISGFICGTRLIDTRDGKSYLTVQIGTQCWFAENLNVGSRINGIDAQTDNAVIEKYCFGDNESSCNLYGGLYLWDEMMQYTTNERAQGVCPVGWHVPSDYEWKVLEMALGMSQVSADGTGWRGTDEGGKLKAAGTTYWDSPNMGATNSSLFTALPSGDRNSSGLFEGRGFFTDFWTSTLIIDTQCWYRYLDAANSQIIRVDGNRRYGTPVRCVKD
jgi:uncharacterized protein (TIGR02145 family)/uncharacterized repeat protein (TIGR02059 family)